MMRPSIVLYCILTGYVSGNFNDNKIVNNTSLREGKFWSIGIVRFENSNCVADDGFDGTCYTRRECRNIGGIAAGWCASHIGVCCVVQRTCGGITSYNNTFFLHPGFPSSLTGGSSCSLTIQRCNSDICQVRLDFLSLSFAQPNANGSCVYDALNIIGGASIIPTICGENSGQHIYVDFNANEDIRIVISTSADFALARSWKIKVSQIACDCGTRAPSGCLMYYTDVSGIVNSFNYGTTVSSELIGNGQPGTRELANLNYGVCVEMLPGYCGIRWSQTASPYSFTVSQDTLQATAAGTVGTPAAGASGANCPNDFIVVPNPSTNGVPLNTDRFCGNGLPVLTIISIWGIGIVRFANSVCPTFDGREGTCYTKRECRSIGSRAGACASNVGVCCVVQKTCGGSSSHNNTYFVNPGFPSTYAGSTRCTLIINKCNSGICQVRIDFLSLRLAQPNGNGICVTDSLNIVGGSTVPIICGENSGQHVYVNFNGEEDIRIVISTGAADYARSWNIKVSQIDCASPSRAPTGCLMYYTDLTGTVTSFNYGATVSGDLNGATPNRPGTRELANLNYGVCVAMQAGFCSINWSQTAGDPYSFTVSDNTIGASVDPGLPSGGLMGALCTTDFVIIPNPMGLVDDRFCGNAFPSLTTSSKPFVMTVVTDANDLTDIGNRGFSLSYSQVRCTVR